MNYKMVTSLRLLQQVDVRAVMQKGSGLNKDAEDESEEFARLFPALSKELKDSQDRVKINGVRSEPETPSSRRQISGKNWQGYDPDVIDFIRRAKTKEDAIEVINYMSLRGEISQDYATRLINQLNEHGLESFGKHKSPGYYFNRFDK